MLVPNCITHLQVLHATSHPPDFSMALVDSFMHSACVSPQTQAAASLIFLVQGEAGNTA